MKKKQLLKPDKKNNSNNSKREKDRNVNYSKPVGASLRPKRSLPKQGTAKDENLLVLIARAIVSVFNKYYLIHFPAIAIMLALVIFSGDFFKAKGVIVIIVFLIYISVYYLNKWLNQFDDN